MASVNDMKAPPTEEKEGIALKVVNALDIYGLTQAPSYNYNPKAGPKTKAGAIFGVLSIALVLALWIFFLIAFLDNENTTVTFGETVSFNPKSCKLSDIVGGGAVREGEEAKDKKPVVDIPALSATFGQEIFFYEELSPSLQRIEVADETGYNPYFSNTESKIHETISVHQKLSVPLNSYDPNFQQDPTPNPPAEFSVKETIAIQSGHVFTSETLKSMYEVEGILGSSDEFYPHSVHSYARFERDQLSLIKKCQLQVQLSNRGVYETLNSAEVLTDRDFQSSAYFPTLTTSNFTFAATNFVPVGKKTKTYEWRYGLNAKQAEELGIDRKDFDVLYLETKFNQADRDSFVSDTSFGPAGKKIDAAASAADISETMFNDYKFSVTYVNNMIKTFTDVTCHGEPFMEFYWGSVFSPTDVPDLTSATFTLANYALFDGDDVTFDSQGGFQILLTSAWGQEIVTVTAWDLGLATIDITRSAVVGAKIDHSLNNEIFAAWSEEYSVYTADALENYFQLNIPTNWKCAFDAYNAGDGVCDCNCGGWDPDCGTAFNLPSSTNGCAATDVCNLSGKCMALNVDFVELYINRLIFSYECDAINFPGEEAITGYVGDRTTFDGESKYLSGSSDACGSCPGDDLFGNTVSQTDNGEFLCSNSNAGTSFNSVLFNGLDGNPLENGSLTLTSHTKTTPFPVTDLSANTGVREYRVILSAGDGNQETVTVTFAGAADDFGTQTLTVARKKSGNPASYQRPAQNHVSLGYMIGSFSPASNKVFVFPKASEAQGAGEGDPDLTAYFDKKGPYTVLINGVALRVASATPVTSRRNYQELTLSEPVEETVGTISVLTEPADFADTTITIRAAGFGSDDIGAVLFDGQPALGILRNGIDVEVFTIVSVTDSGWTCPIEFFNDGTFCDCGCGIYDPDCGDPNIKPDTYSCGTDQDDVNGYEYCTYPAAVCTTTQPSTATVFDYDTIDRFVETITITEPLRNNWMSGAIFESSTYLNEETEQVQSDIEVVTVFDIVMERLEDTFLPENRFMNNGVEATRSPGFLDVDLSTYIVPDRNAFADLDLCPAVSTSKVPEKQYKTFGWETWSVRPDRTMSIDCDPSTGTTGMQSFDSSACLSAEDYKGNSAFNGVFDAVCTDMMPPTRSFKFDVVKPLNNVWDIPTEAWATSGSLTNEPEWNIDISHTYTFSHSSRDDGVENDFAEGGRSTGDIDQDQNAMFFSGATNYRGLGAGGSSSATRGVPANNPYLKPSITIKAATLYASEDIKACAPATWPSDLAKIDDIVDKFEDIEIAIPTSSIGGVNGQFLLEPGFLYTITVHLSIYPIYKRTQWFDATTIDSFSHYISSVEMKKERTDYFQRQVAKVHYLVMFDSDVQVQIISHRSSVEILMAQLSSGYVYIGVGFALLGIWQKLRKQEPKHAAWAVANNFPLRKIMKKTEAATLKTAISQSQAIQNNDQNIEGEIVLKGVNSEGMGI